MVEIVPNKFPFGPVLQTLSVRELHQFIDPHTKEWVVRYTKPPPKSPEHLEIFWTSLQTLWDFHKKKIPTSGPYQDSQVLMVATWNDTSKGEITIYDKECISAVIGLENFFKKEILRFEPGASAPPYYFAILATVSFVLVKNKSERVGKRDNADGSYFDGVES